MRKMKAWMQKGVVIHDAVKAAQRGWSSLDKSKKVAKSVEMSDRPRMTLKKTNLQSVIILRVSTSSIDKMSYLALIFILSPARKSLYFFNHLKPLQATIHLGLKLAF